MCRDFITYLKNIWSQFINKLEDECDVKWCRDFITYLKNIWSHIRIILEYNCDVKWCQIK